MKKHQYLRILTMAALVLVLFGAIWKAAYPIRMKRQFESQFREQLKDAAIYNKPYPYNKTFVLKFSSLRIGNVDYDPKLEIISVRYELNYVDKPGNAPLPIWTSCQLTRVDDTFRGSCLANYGKPANPNTPAFVNIILYK